MKLVCIMAALMLILSSFPLNASDEKYDGHPSICIINGFFKYLGEDEGKIYFRAIYGRMAFISEEKGAGILYIMNSNISFSKPFHSLALSLDNYTLIILAFSSNWDFIDSS